MLSKRLRLAAAEVREVIKTGRSARVGSISAKYVVAQGFRAAVVVSTKVAKTAVKRNSLRRAAYAALAPLLPKDRHVVFFLHQPAVDSDALAQLCSKLS